LSNRTQPIELKFRSDPRIEFSFLIGDVARQLRRAFDKEMESVGLTRSQWRALVFVLRLDGPTQAELADALDITRPSVGALIDQLENSGYVTRERDPHDRRIWRIVPTRWARQQTDQFAASAERVAAQAFGNVSADDLAAGKGLLQTLQENLSMLSVDQVVE